MPEMNARTFAAGIVAALVLAMLFLHLVPPVFVATLVFVLIRSLAGFISRFRNRQDASLLAVVIVSGVVLGGLAAIGIGLTSLFHQGGGLAALSATLAKALEGFSRTLPPAVAAYIPDSVEELQKVLASWLREHSAAAGAFGSGTVVIVIQAIIAAIAAGMLAVHVSLPRSPGPLPVAITERMSVLVGEFRQVAFAQIWISSVNTLLTGLFLFLVLPAMGIEIHFRWMLVAITFSAGMIPILGNLISNTAITLLAAAVSFQAAMAALVFLVALHKLEYFLNARIVGGHIEAKAWELLMAMLLMEAAFGLQGLVAAPVLYAWLKREARLAGLA